MTDHEADLISEPPPDFGIPAVPEQDSGILPGFRRTDPMTAVIHGVQSMPLPVAAIMLGVLPVDLDFIPRLLVALAASALLAVVVASYQYLAWQRFNYGFDTAGDLIINKGLIDKSTRRVALSRIQSVEIAQPLVARFLGFAEVRVEVAGGDDSRVALKFLRDDEASRLRAEILARAAGLSAEAGPAPEVALAQVPTKQLWLSLLLGSEFLIAIAISAVLIGVTLATEGAWGMFGLLLTGGLPIIAAINKFTKWFGFTVNDSQAGVRLRSGLLQTQSQTVPPGRVHALEFEQPVLWRSRDWERINLTLAGQADGGDGDDNSPGLVLIPVAEAEFAHHLARRVYPELDLTTLQWQPVEPRVRQRAPLQWKRLAYALTPTFVAVRSGWLTRRIAIAPFERIQSVGVVQGPWQRRLDIATVEVHMVPGSITTVAYHRRAAEARLLAAELAQRARLARASAPAERWMTTQQPSEAAEAGRVE